MFFEDRSLAPYEGDEPYLFLSYSHKDSEKAGKIIRVLKKNGFREKPHGLTGRKAKATVLVALPAS